MIVLAQQQPQRLAVKVKPIAERSIRRGHPWIFSDSISQVKGRGKAGDICIIFDQKKNKLLAVGLFDPDSPMRIKLVSFQQSAQLDEAWFRQSLTSAYDKRAPLLATATNSYRLVHGENDGLPGLVADVYAEVLVLKLYSRIWWPYLNIILPLLQEISGCNTGILRLSRNLVAQSDQLEGLHDGQILWGDLTNEEVIFQEHGLSFSANLVHGHKTGFFLDHRLNRKRVGQLAKDKRVLDIFAYAGGFSVHALAGGAKEVTSLDISAQALAIAKKNVVLNQDRIRGQHEIIAEDAFKAMETLQKQGEVYDLIIVDPPSFAKSAAEVNRALSSYERLARLAMKLVAPKGILLLASCSSRVVADEFFNTVEQVLDLGERFQLLEKTFHDVDHPVGFPEGAYLKCGYYQRI